MSIMDPTTPPTLRKAPLAPGSIQPGDYLRCPHGTTQLVVYLNTDGDSVGFGHEPDCIYTLADLMDCGYQHMNRLGKDWHPTYRMEEDK